MRASSIGRNEAGVAMVVVLLVAAVLTVTASTAAFMTIRDFSASADDRRGSQALAYSEAGIDRTIAEIEGGRWVWKDIASSGCSDAILTARGYSAADLDRFPLYIGAAVGTGVGSPLLAGTGGDIGTGGRYRGVLDTCLLVSGGPTSAIPFPRGVHEVDLRAIGEHPTARREVIQRVTVEPKGLPVGLYAHNSVTVNGSGALRGVNLVTPGPIVGRDKIAFFGIDPYYVKADFYPCEGTDVPGVDCFDDTTGGNGGMPAAAHSGDTITCSSNCPRGPASSEPLDPREHPAVPDDRSPNCWANRVGGTDKQSLWDSSDWTDDPGEAAIGSDPCGWTPPAGWVGNDFPPTSLFTDEEANRLAPTPQLSDNDLASLKSQAQTSGLYCGTELSSDGSFNCYRQGVPRSSMVTSGGVKVAGSMDGAGTGDLLNVPKVFVAYVDFPAGEPDNQLEWAGDMSVGGVRACQQSPNHRSATIILRNGDLNGAGNIFFNGTVIASEGEVDLDGNFNINGTVIARTIEIISGASITLDECWVQNMQSAGFEVSPLTWSEIDR